MYYAYQCTRLYSITLYCIILIYNCYALLLYCVVALKMLWIMFQCEMRLYLVRTKMNGYKLLAK